MQQLIDKDRIREVYAIARKEAYAHDPVIPEVLLAVTQVYSQNSAFDSRDSMEFGREVAKAAAATGWSPRRIYDNFVRFGALTPKITFDPDEWEYVRCLNLKFLEEKPSENVFLCFKYGIAQRSASEIIQSNPYIFGQPNLWLGYLKEYGISTKAQFQLEAEELQLIFQSNIIRGPMDLFIKYVGRRLHKEGLLNHPLAKDMHTAWLHLKNTIQDLEYEEAGL